MNEKAGTAKEYTSFTPNEARSFQAQENEQRGAGKIQTADDLLAGYRFLSPRCPTTGNCEAEDAPDRSMP